MKKFNGHLFLVVMSIDFVESLKASVDDVDNDWSYYFLFVSLEFKTSLISSIVSPLIASFGNLEIEIEYPKLASLP